MSSSDRIIYAWVPGLPHLLRPDLNEGYENLAQACRDLGDEFKRQGVSRILFYSTQWLSVLGQSVQARPRVSGLHVDENWYDIASLNFDFEIDSSLVENLIIKSRQAGFQVRAVDYEGFPIDTGTIVANTLLNNSGLKAAMYSCCVYSDYAETVRIGELAADAAMTLSGKTAIVVVSGLSGRYFTEVIDYKNDAIRDPIDDQWNQKILASMNDGLWENVASMRDEYNRSTKADMGLKALAFLEGAGACRPGRRLMTKAYGAIYGTGAAVMVGA
jgi:2-aminophenol/2-amino-5-chlorophenol 1,6-dioxygenase alpha subunit